MAGNSVAVLDIFILSLSSSPSVAGLSKEQRLQIGVKTFDRLFRETPEVPWLPLVLGCPRK